MSKYKRHSLDKHGGQASKLLKKTTLFTFGRINSVPNGENRTEIGVLKMYFQFFKNII